MRNRALAEADLVLVLDSDVPWIPLFNYPSHDAKIIHIDVDPIKERTPLWYLSASYAFRADCATALRQIHRLLDQAPVDEAVVQERRAHHGGLHRDWAAALEAKERKGGAPTAEYVTARDRRRCHCGQ